MVEKIWLLPTGGLCLDRSILLTGKDFGIKQDVPVFAVLVKTEEEYILIDTGLNPNGLTNPEKTWGERAKHLLPILTEEDNVARRLNELDVSVSDIKYVVNTHMHWDHTGGNQFFDNAIFVVQKAEYRFAMYPDSYLSGSYMSNHYNANAKYHLIEGDYTLCEGVDLLFTPGHTPGHQSVLLTMGNGSKVIIPGDSIYTKENIELMSPSGNNWCINTAVFSLNRLVTLSRFMGARMIPSHDPERGVMKEIEVIE